MTNVVKKALEVALTSAKFTLQCHQDQLKDESRELAEMIKQDRLGRQKQFVLEIGQWVRDDKAKIEELEEELRKHG